MSKKTVNRFGKHFLLGKKLDGTLVWLERPSFDCDWYWGFGYLHEFTNNKNPKLSKDIASHYHFDGTFDSYEKILPNRPKSFLEEYVLTEHECWKLYELMKSAYIARNYSDMLHARSAHITTNPCGDTIANDAEYKRIVNIVLPNIFKEIELLLSPESESEEVAKYWDKIIEYGVVQ